MPTTENYMATIPGKLIAVSEGSVKAMGKLLAMYIGVMGGDCEIVEEAVQVDDSWFLLYVITVHATYSWMVDEFIRVLHVHEVRTLEEMTMLETKGS